MRSYKTKLFVPSLLSVFLLAGCGSETNDSTPKTEMVKPVEAQTTQTAPKVEATTLTPEELGKKVYARCRTCHTLEEGGKNRVGPNLWMVFGKKAGTAEGYAYSKAIQASDITWDDASMDAYIENPKSFIPGNKMVFVGLRKEQDRQNLIAYLKANTGAE